ncbi:ABC transporter ATP-binding protein [Acidimangrovimonas sediminis]|uniref:ABC transporter ATP-binding protein n=1 Tax=Acidimangrovimonas sediminis TaxID=2056283 RepID=UPI000C7FB477|nr:oligopeptide/dipeptide ABC transporter ATP-binding protein [Acidimangrovimonas sediminis]
MSQAPIVEVQNLARNYPIRQGWVGARRDVWALAGVDLAIAPGETVGVVGESGCGKSTLGRLILGLDRPSRGTVTFEGRDLAEIRGGARRALRKKMQLVFQDPFGSLDPRRAVGAQIADGLRNHHVVPAAETGREVARLLELVGLDAGAAARRPHEFSGGQRQRIAVARALAPRPDFIVADEPVSALDVSIQAQIVNLLADLRADLNLAMLFISHDLHVVRHLSSRLIVMYLGRVVEEGPAAAIFAAPRHPYTAALMAATPALGSRPDGRAPALGGELPSPANPPSGCAFRTRCPFAVEACAGGVPPLSVVARGHRAACIRSEDIAAMGGPVGGPTDGGPTA